MVERAIGWSEENSKEFIDFGDVITPSREEQLEMIAALVPAGRDDRFVAVDLACGAGLLSATLLERFPGCRVIALDGSRKMLDTASGRLAPFGARAKLDFFDLAQRDWLERLPADVRCFVSSLAIHHLDGEEKRELFSSLARRLPVGGALLIADIVEPMNEYARWAFAETWDGAVKEQSMRVHGTLDAYQRFREGWNHYVEPDVEFDKPSGLFEQLQWLSAAGFSRVDCFWLRAGHAIYGGYR